MGLFKGLAEQPPLFYFPPGISIAPGYFWPLVSPHWRLGRLSLDFLIAEKMKVWDFNQKLKKIIILGCPNSFPENTSHWQKLSLSPFFSSFMLWISSLIKKNCLPDVGLKVLVYFNLSSCSFSPYLSQRLDNSITLYSPILKCAVSLSPREQNEELYISLFLFPQSRSCVNNKQSL